MPWLAAFVCAFLALAPASAQVSGRAFQGFAGDGDGGPINIEADDLRIEEQKGIAVYEGNVVVRRGASTVRTGRLTVEFSAQSGLTQDSIDRLRFAGGLVVTNGDNVITADGGRFNVRTEEVLLTGKVVVSQGDNVAKGCKLVADMRTNRARLEGCPVKGRKKGRVQSVFTPGSTPSN